LNCYVHTDRPAVAVCVACGRALCESCANNVGGKFYCDACSSKLSVVPPTTQTGGRSKVAAGLFGILLGGLGVHKFYLGQVGWGIVYLLFFWTCIPAIAGLIEGILYLTMSDTEFNAKYNAPAGSQGTGVAG